MREVLYDSTVKTLAFWALPLISTWLLPKMVKSFGLSIVMEVFSIKTLGLIFSLLTLILEVSDLLMIEGSRIITKAAKAPSKNPKTKADRTSFFINPARKHLNLKCLFSPCQEKEKCDKSTLPKNNMEITSLGFSAFRIKGKSAVIVVEPYEYAGTGMKFPRTEADIVTLSSNMTKQDQLSAISGSPMIIDGPGEYEVKGVGIIGLVSEGQNVIYHFKIDNLVIVYLGKLNQKLEDKQKEMLNGADILIIPVGGYETLSAETAPAVISQIEPSIIIPSNYKTNNLSKDLAEKLQGVDLFLKQMGKEGIAPQSKLNITRDKLPVEPTIIVLE